MRHFASRAAIVLAASNATLFACGGETLSEDGSAGAAGNAASAGVGGVGGSGAGTSGAGGGSAGDGGTSGTALPTGYYYFLFELDYLATQLQLYAWLDSGATGFEGLFTNANRRIELNTRPGCPACSADSPICALLPAPACVKPSEKQYALEHYVDFLPEPDPPDGYTFVVGGSATHAPYETTLQSEPFQIEVTLGSGGISVSMENARLTGKFDQLAAGRWLGSGSLSVEKVKINGSGDSPTQGVFKAMSLTASEVAAVESFGHPIPMLP